MTNMESIDIHSRFEASVNIFVDPSQKAQVIDALEKVENIEQIYDVKGEFDIVSIVSASSVEDFRNILHKKILKIKVQNQNSIIQQNAKNAVAQNRACVQKFMAPICRPDL